MDEAEKRKLPRLPPGSSRDSKKVPFPESLAGYRYLHVYEETAR